MKPKEWFERDPAPLLQLGGILLGFVLIMASAAMFRFGIPYDGEVGCAGVTLWLVVMGSLVLGR